jgi:uncharacterized membrane protein YkvA (DUF1232 family)
VSGVLRGVLYLLNMTGVPRLVVRLMMDRRVPLRVKLILPAALVYLISPFDVVHDIVPIFGRIDDVLVLIFSLVFFLGTAPREIVMEHLRGPRSGDTQSGSDKKKRGSVIEGEYQVLDEDERAS